MAKKVDEKNNEIEILKNDLKKDIDNHINEQVNKTIKNELEKNYKKIIKSKNLKIFIKNIIIILLILVIIYLLYLLKEANYFDKYFINSTNKEINNEIIEEKNNEKKEENNLEKLKEQYSYLLDKIYLNESSEYIDSFYEGKLTKEIKSYLTVNNLPNSSLTIENNYNIIDNNEFKKIYESLFNDVYEPINFEYNDNYIRYISKLDSYISNDLITNNSTDIVKEIIDIKVSDKEIDITTIEGLNRENKIFNILTKEEICEISKITSNKEKLNTIIYKFNNDKKLIEISIK